ncbi:MAG: hypothetical protein R3B70_10965 [Polyangiaceae bacterium]
MSRLTAGTGICALAVFVFTACVPPPPPEPPPAPTAEPVATAEPAPTAAPVAAPKGVLPELHPCVPTFVQRELSVCEPGSEPADYSAVARAMDAMIAAGPVGPQPKQANPVPRELTSGEEDAARVGRAFLCRAAPGELDDEGATTAFDLGRLYLRANHFEEAVVFLHRAALLDPATHAEVEYAARFLLEALAPLEATRPECAGILARAAVAADEHVCEGDGAAGRDESCAAIKKVRDASAKATP